MLTCVGGWRRGPNCLARYSWRTARSPSRAAARRCFSAAATSYAAFQMRGVALVVAVTVVAEVGDFRRFANPRQLMAYLGLVPNPRMRACSTGVFGSCLLPCAPVLRPDPSAAAERNNAPDILNADMRTACKPKVGAAVESRRQVMVWPETGRPIFELGSVALLDGSGTSDYLNCQSAPATAMRAAQHRAESTRMIRAESQRGARSCAADRLRRASGSAFIFLRL